MEKLKTEKINQKKIKKKKSKNPRVLIFLGLFLLIIGIGIYCYNLFEYSKPLVEDKELIDEFFNEETINNKQIQTSVKQSTSNKYIAILEIPSISLKTGLVDFKFSGNNVDKRVQIITGSQMPNVENGNLILAAHSGTSNISYFKNLYKMQEGNEIYIYYSGTKYVYVLNNIYDVNKTGEVEIKRDPNQNALTLITCTRNSNTKQTVYIAYLKNKEQY